MSLEYGVLAGKVDIYKREDDQDSPHLQIRVIDRNNQKWRIPVNVLSSDQSLLIFHRVDPLQSHPILENLGALGPGFNLRSNSMRSAANALDFSRSPLFDWKTGIEVLNTGPGATDDLQDFLIAELESLKAQNGDIFVFGAKFPKTGEPSRPRPIDREFGTMQGIHDIHMNQGNPPGRFESDNGIFQDGGLILQFNNRYVGLFLRFQSQWLPTNDQTGNRIPNVSQPIPAGTSTPNEPDDGDTQPDISSPDIYIERALVNPIGDDTRQEVVVLGNLTTIPVNLSDWSLVDRNGKVEMLSGMLDSGESRKIMLSGNGAQLSNKGGTIRLKDANGNQVHAVSYSKDDARHENRYLRFVM